MVDVRDRTYEAIVLRARDYREQDRLLTVASAEHGPEAVIARGAKKAGSSLSACSQPFCRASITLSPAKNGVSFLKEGRQEESYLPALGDVERFAYLSYFSELLLAGWPENRPEPELYALARAAFLLIKLDDGLSRTARFFELRLLDALGLLPELTACAACGQELTAMAPRRFYLSPERGQLLCESCSGAQVAGAPQVAGATWRETAGGFSRDTASTEPSALSAGSLRIMERLRSTPLSRVSQLRLSQAQDREIEQALTPYLAYHLEYAGRAKAVLKELL